MSRLNVLEAVNQASDLPALPANMAKLLDALRDPNARIDEILSNIAMDQAITAKILRLVNSSFYGMSGRITSLKQAVVLLGLQTVENVIISMSLANAFRLPDLGDVDFSINDFWEHTVGTGLICHTLAKHQRLVDSADAFVAGLLHDIGKLLLLHVAPEEFAKVLQTIRDQNLFSCEAESRLLSANHAVAGAWLAKRWRLPDVLVESILFHHTPLEAQHPFAGIIHVADSLCTAFGVGSSGCDLVAGIEPEVWQNLNISTRGLDGLLKEIDQALQDVSNTVTLFQND